MSALAIRARPLPTTTAATTAATTTGNEQHLATIAAMRRLSKSLYWMCFCAGAGSRTYGFIEFRGLMDKYIDVMARVEDAHDPHQVDQPAGAASAVTPEDIAYVTAKLRTLFGPMIHSTPAARQAFISGMGLGPIATGKPS